MSSRRLPRLRVALAAVALLTGALVHVVYGYGGGVDTSEHAWGADDAYVSFRYAHNLVEGHGLVFNPGERVEGYTNLLFVLLAAALLRVVGEGAIYPATTALNLGLLLVALALFHVEARRLLGARSAALGAGLLALVVPLWLWAASGLESILVLALQLGLWRTVGAIERGGRWGWPAFAAASSLLVLARADGFLWPGVAIVYFALRDRGRALRAAAVTAPAVAGLFGWRWVYYGELWPNTYYVKVAEPLAVRLGQGLEQLWGVMTGTGLLPYLAALGVSGAWMVGDRLRRRRAGIPAGGARTRSPSSPAPLRQPVLRPRDPRPACGVEEDRPAWASGGMGFGALLGACVVGYWLYVGGDHFGERFLLVLYPLGIVALLGLLRELAGWRLGLPAVLLAGLSLWPLVADPRFAYADAYPYKYDCWVTLGRHLGETVEGAPLLAVDAAGKIPYFSGLPALDMRGLTDRHIARVEAVGYDSPGHNKRDPAYVLSRRPRLVSGWVTPGLEVAPGLERGLWVGAGYRLVLMLNTSRRSYGPGLDLVDVRGAGDEEILALIARGYRYGLLTRDP